MIPALAITLALLAEPVPGDALRLAPDPAEPTVAAVTTTAPPSPASSLWEAAAGALAGVAAGVAALAAGTWATRREQELAVAAAGGALMAARSRSSSRSSRARPRRSVGTRFTASSRSGTAAAPPRVSSPICQR